MTNGHEVRQDDLGLPLDDPGVWDKSSPTQLTLFSPSLANRARCPGRERGNLSLLVYERDNTKEKLIQLLIRVYIVLKVIRYSSMCALKCTHRQTNIHARTNAHTYTHKLHIYRER